MKEKLVILPRTKVVVVGDLHGDVNSLRKIISRIDISESIIVFLGDYADRGEYGLEIYETLARLKEKHPERVVMLKGNHESYTKFKGEIIPLFAPCTFIDELRRKVENWREKLEDFYEFWSSLPIAAILEGKTLFVHGCVSTDVKSIEDLRFPTPNVEEDVLWSDPKEDYGEEPNPRGAGVLFGQDVTLKVCKALNVKMIIRSHQPSLPEVLERGFTYHHNGMVLTVSSTTVYGGKPAFVEVDENGKLNVRVV